MLTDPSYSTVSSIAITSSHNWRLVSRGQGEGDWARKVRYARRSVADNESQEITYRTQMQHCKPARTNLTPHPRQYRVNTDHKPAILYNTHLHRTCRRYNSIQLEQPCRLSRTPKLLSIGFFSLAEFLRSMTHEPETGIVNRRLKSDSVFRCLSGNIFYQRRTFWC